MDWDLKKKEGRRREIQCQGSGEDHACTWQRTCLWARGIGGGSTRGRRNWRQRDKPNQSIGMFLSLRRRAQRLLHSTTLPSSSSSSSCVAIRYATIEYCNGRKCEVMHSLTLFALFFSPKRLVLVQPSLIYVPCLHT